MVLLDRWPGDPGRKQRHIVRAKHSKMQLKINTLHTTYNNDYFVGPATTASSSCMADTGSTTSLTASSIHTVDKASADQSSIVCSNSSNTLMTMTPQVIVTNTVPCNTSTLSVSSDTTPDTWQHPCAADLASLNLTMWQWLTNLHVCIDFDALWVYRHTACLIALWRIAAVLMTMSTPPGGVRPRCHREPQFLVFNLTYTKGSRLFKVRCN